jgi:hypothetical protein
VLGAAGMSQLDPARATASPPCAGESPPVSRRPSQSTMRAYGPTVRLAGELTAVALRRLGFLPAPAQPVRHSDAVETLPDEPIPFDPAHWMILVYRIPTEPTRLRAGVWRKLKGLGAIYIQSSSAALPASSQAERALRGLRAEITDMGGSATLFSATTLAGQDQLVNSFNAVRDDEYEEIIDRCDDFQRQVRKEHEANHFTYPELEENEVDLVKLKGWFDRIRARDVLGASKLDLTTQALRRCEQALEEYAARVYAEEGEEPSPL